MPDNISIDENKSIKGLCQSEIEIALSHCALWPLSECGQQVTGSLAAKWKVVTKQSIAQPGFYNFYYMTVITYDVHIVTS